MEFCLLLAISFSVSSKLTIGYIKYVRLRVRKYSGEHCP